MRRSITVAGELASTAEYRETAAGKVASLTVVVTTKRRDRETDEWVTDPPVTYQVLVTDDEGMAAVAAMAPGDRILLSGALRDDAAAATIDAETVMPGAHFARRA